METTTEDFRIQSLRRDRDAMLLIGLSIVLGLLVLVGLAFLPADAWDRLTERSELMWGVLVAVAPTVLVVWQRYKLRRDAVLGLGKAASAPTVVELHGEPVDGTAAYIPVGATPAPTTSGEA